MRVLLAVVVTCAAAAAADPLKIVVPDFNAIGPSKEKAVFFTEHISGRLSEAGAQVTTQRALQQLLGIERQRQLMGCAGEGGSCVAELANALGTDAVLLGDIAQIDSLFQLNLKLIEGATGKVVSSHQARVNNESALLDELDQAAYALVSDAAAALHRDAPRRRPTRGPSLSFVAIAPLALGAGAAVASAVLFQQAGATYARIPQKAGDTPLPTSDVEALGSKGSTLQTAAWICASVGAAAVVTGAILMIIGQSKTPSASAGVVALPRGGAAVVAGGTF